MCSWHNITLNYSSPVSAELVSVVCGIQSCIKKPQQKSFDVVVIDQSELRKRKQFESRNTNNVSLKASVQIQHKSPL